MHRRTPLYTAVHRRTPLYTAAACKHQDCFGENSEDIQALLGENIASTERMATTQSTSKKSASSNIRHTVQWKLRVTQDFWLSRKTDEIRSSDDTHDMENIYCALKEIYGPAPSRSTTLPSGDGATRITEIGKILDRRAEHFNSFFNRPSSINDEAIKCLPQAEANESLAEPPTLLEIQKAISRLSSGKPVSADSIRAEFYNMGGNHLVEKTDRALRSHVGSERHTPGLLKCFHHPSLQAENKSTAWHIPALYNRQDSC